jgi:outer membrane protein OmpA-like peptidoglycan-associated protein
MNTSGQTYSLIATVPIIIALATSGCATKKYVRVQVDGVNQRVSQIQTQTNEQLAKDQTHLSRLDERVTTLDGNLASVANAARQASAAASASAAQANTTAGQALEMAQADSSKIDAASAKVESNSEQIITLTNAQNYTLAETANVTFATNRSDLSDAAKIALDVVVQKATSQPRTVLEVTGFTDQIGPNSYNLALSQRRAEAVARYLVRQNIPLKDISILGMGEEQTPEQIAAEVQAADPNATNQDLRSLARRVRIRLYTPGGSTSAQAGGSQAGGTVASAQQ